jgi:hypothetical protein
VPKTQESIFEDIQQLAADVSILRGYVQNDFKQMIADGYVTPAEIAESAVDAANAFDRCIDTLANLRTEVLSLLGEHSTPISEGDLDD